MTERNPALWLQNRTDHTAEQERALITGLYLGKEGVMAQDDLKVVQRAAGANMSVDVGAGKATVVGDDNAAQGIYAVWNDAAKNVTISAADGTNPRRDIIVARVKDAFYSGASNAFSIEVITGTPAGSPADPSIPNNCLPLARVAVAAGASSITNANITDLRNRVGTMAACDILCTSTTRPASPFVGMKIYETDTAKELVYAGATSGWNPPWNLPWGIIARSADITTIQTGVTTRVDMTGFTVTFTAVAGRRYRMVAMCETYGSTAPQFLGIYLVVGGVDKRACTYGFATANTQMETPASCDFTAAAGSLTVKSAITAGPAGNVSVHNTSSVPGYLYVEDIGPSANPS